jgi:hypothetical protein
MKYDYGEEEFVREVIYVGDSFFAVVWCMRKGKRELSWFAIPPDGQPTGRLWARLEKALHLH